MISSHHATPASGVCLTIAMPAFNEEKSIEKAVVEAEEAARGLGESAEIFVVDDASTDRTPEILDELQRRISILRVVRNETNGGISVFNRRMMDEARGEWVFFIGSDCEWDCAEAVRFLEVARAERCDAVLGYRTTKHYSLERKIVSWCFNALVFLLFGARFRDIGSIRLLRKSTFGGVPLYSRSAFLNAERLLVGERRGARYRQVPVAHRKRFAGKGKGARTRPVVRSILDLVKTRWRWFRFERYYA